MYELPANGNEPTDAASVAAIGSANGGSGSISWKTIDFVHKDKTSQTRTPLTSNVVEVGCYKQQSNGGKVFSKIWGWSNSAAPSSKVNYLDCAKAAVSADKPYFGLFDPDVGNAADGGIDDKATCVFFDGMLLRQRILFSNCRVIRQAQF